MPAARKTIPIDTLRELLGPEQTDELLEKLSPAVPSVRVQLNELNLARVLFADPVTESKKWDATLPVVRRYFLDRGQARRHFLDWIERAQADPDAGEGASVAAPARRKVVDPVVLEKRRAALAKARAVRSEKRRQQKAS